MTAPTNIATTNWSGAVITAASGESFSTVSAQWVVPNVAQVPIKGVTLSDVSEWVGIDGYGSADICQAGVVEIVQTSAHGHTTITCEAFDEWYPAAGNIIPASSFQVNPGDTIKVTVETTGAGATKALFIFDDETTHQIYATSLTAPQGTSLQGNSAEVIVETPELISGTQVLQPLLATFSTSCQSCSRMSVRSIQTAWRPAFHPPNRSACGRTTFRAPMDPTFRKPTAASGQRSMQSQ